MPDGGGINWKRTGLIVGGVAALALAYEQPWERFGGDHDHDREHSASVDLDRGEDARRAVTIRDGDGNLVIERRVEDAAEGIDGAAAEFETADWDEFEVRMERLGARMAELENELEEPGADREAIEAEMGEVGREMARTGVDAASTAIKAAIGR